MKALIVDEPWVSLMLRGERMWEMRSNHTPMRGRIALIRKGLGTVVGLADLLDSIGPLDEIAWRAYRGRHKIPLQDYPAVEAMEFRLGTGRCPILCVVVADHEQVLEQLLLMTVPRWRRPNPNGNWGIVSGIEWKPADQMGR